MSSSSDPTTARGLLPPGDIAIVGMACVFPGAPDVQTYWENIVSKVDAVTDPPEDWGADLFYDPDAQANDRIYCKRGGYLGELARFNPLEFGIMPLSIDGGEPDHYLALRLASEALADAGYDSRAMRGERMEVIMGRGTYVNRGWTTLVQHGVMVDQTLRVLKTLHPEYSAEELQAIKRELKDGLPPFNAETAPGLIPNIITGRIANRLDLMGPNYIVDAACASSLIAVETAVRDLLTRKCDLALAGGVQASTPAPLHMIFCQLGALSRQCEIRPFDKDADGTMLGEGAGIVVLKRREDAERDGDRIYALIKGVGVASDGRGQGLLTPRVEGEALALQRAYEIAGISPRTVELIEAHGTGTPVGDQAEIEALRRVFGACDEARRWCALGTVKSMISHLIPAAGIAGLIKASLAVYHKVLPPTLHCAEPNPEFELDKSPFYMNTETRPWIHGAPESPRRAGVNAFGFGGINAHVIVEEHPADGLTSGTEALSFHRRWDSEVLIAEGESRQALLARGQQIQRAARYYAASASQDALRDLAYTVNSRLEDAPYRLAIVASSLQDLDAKLARALLRLADAECSQIKDRRGIYFFQDPLARQGKLAFLFPGEGSQYVNMLSDLCLHFPEVRDCFDLIDRIFVESGRGDDLPSRIVFPPPDGKGEGGRLWQMESAVAAVTTANQALLTLLGRLDIQPDALVGHSTGEYTALQASGIMDLGSEPLYEQYVADLDTIYQRMEAEDRIPQATLVAVGADSKTVSQIISPGTDGVFIAMDNCPHQTVIAGERAALDGAIEHMRRQGLIYEILSFDRPYHTPVFEVYADSLRPFFRRWLTSSPRVPLYSCTTTAPFPADLAQIQELAYQHWVRPVEFRKTVEAMHADGVRIFLEVGPKGNLAAFVDDILRTQPHLAVPLNTPSRTGITQLNHAMALLAAQGVHLRLDHLYARRAPRTLSLETSGQLEHRESPTGSMKLALGLPILRVTERERAGIPPKEGPVNADTDEQMGDEMDEGVSQPACQRATGTAAASGTADEGRRAASARETDAAGPPMPGQAHSPDARSRALQEYLETMESFLVTQQEVMQAFLTGNGAHGTPSPAPALSGGTTLWPNGSLPGSGPDHPAGSPMEASVTPSRHVPLPGDQVPQDKAPQQEPFAAPAASGKAASPPAGTAQVRTEPVGNVLLRLVSDKTGYPTEMLDLTLNLEADLGIDSIKRVEIVGALQRETGTFESEELEQVAGLKTLQEMIDFLETDRVARACRVPQDEAPQQGPLAAPAASGKAASPPAGTTQVRTEPVGNVLLRLVSDKTGYPTEMLDLTLNLEADLGIDSIKRVEIVGALQRDTGAFGSEELEQVAGLKTLQEMIDFLETDREAQGCKLPAEQVTGSGSEQAEVHRAPSLPFIGRVVSSVAGEEVVVLREIDLDEDIFLRHHTLGGQVSAADQGLMALPVMPLTMSMEMLAEAAALLVPNRVVVGMRDIRAHRWVTFHEHRLLLQMVARRQSPDEVRVELREAGDPAPARATVTPIVEGIVLFANEYPDPPQGRGLSLRSEHASRWAPEQLYTEGMFHGPSFQGVISLDRWGEDGAEATLQALPDGQLFRSEPHPTFLIDPVLLDAAGQLVGYWAAECLEAGFNVFPFRVEALHLYGPALPAPQRARCQARISLLGDTRVQSDIDVVASDGKMRMQLVGWEDRRFELPEAFYQVRLSPREALLSTPWPTPVARFPAPQTFECCLLQGLPDDFLSGHGMIWQRVLAHLILSRQERETWRGLKGPAKRRSEWLLGRAVAKDAVRLYLRRRRGMELYPADIEIESDEHGRPLAQGAWAAALEDVPALSLAHSGGVAVAIAGDSSLGIGVDIERLGRASLEEIEGLAFTHEERDLLASMGDSEREEWALRLWCAKEAAAKALGRGMVGGPLGLVACEPDIQSGMVRVALAGKMAGLFPELEGRPITAYTAREGGLVVAAALVMRGT